MLTANAPVSSITAWATRDFATQTRTRGGTRETLTKELAVSPKRSAPLRAVTTVTPLANRDMASRKSVGSTGGTGAASLLATVRAKQKPRPAGRGQVADSE